MGNSDPGITCAYSQSRHSGKGWRGRGRQAGDEALGWIARSFLTSTAAALRICRGGGCRTGRGVSHYNV